VLFAVAAVSFELLEPPRVELVALAGAPRALFVKPPAAVRVLRVALARFALGPEVVLEVEAVVTHDGPTTGNSDT
jgi:hypothetical protein